MWPSNVKCIPSVKAVMTPFPHSIEVSEPTTRAREMMAGHGFHHLPVMDRGELVGVVSERDIRRAEIADSGAHQVADVTRHEAFVVDLSEPLDQVLSKMARRQVGSVLVVKEDRLAGIFTVTDACRSFAECLRAQFPSEGGDEAA